MDPQTKRDLETMAEYKARLEAYRRLEERRTRLRRSLHFWVNAHQVVYEPTVAEPTPGGPPSHPALGVGPGAAGSEPLVISSRRFAGQAGSGQSQTALPPRAAETPGPARPHLNPPLATRISAGITFN